jgi:hypothetical protein
MSSLPDVSLGGPQDQSVAAPGPDHGLDTNHRTNQGTNHRTNHRTDDLSEVAEGSPAALLAPVPQAQTSALDRPQQDHQPQHRKAPRADQDQEDQEGALPDTRMVGDRLTMRDRVLMLIGHWWRQIGEGMPSGSVLEARPESLAQYRLYVRSRAWLPEGYQGGAWLVAITVAYYNTLGWLGVALGNATSWLFSRMIHFNIAVVVAVISTVLWICFD